MLNSLTKNITSTGLISSSDDVNKQPVGVFNFMEEIWKKISIVDFGYSISNKGRIKSSNGFILKPFKNNSGYYLIRMSKNGVLYSNTIHRLVAFEFCNPPKDYKTMEVDHIDCNKENNCAENLRWVTKSQNSRFAWDNGLHEKTREKARKRMSKVGAKYSDINGKRLKEYYGGDVGFIEHCKKLSASQRKPIKGENESGNVITFISVSEAKTNGFHNISAALRTGKKYKGYKFYYLN